MTDHLAPFTLGTASRATCRSDQLLRVSPTLLVFAERDCPTTRGTLRVLAESGTRVAVVSQGTVTTARRLAAETGVSPDAVLVEPAPYPVSDAWHVMTVPTLVLVGSDGTEQGRCEGWDRAHARTLVAAAGGILPETDLPDQKPGCAALNTLDPEMQPLLESPSGGADSLIEEMWRRGWHDGLPTVPPTPERVDAMLGDRDPGLVVGTVPPVDGVLTLERLAACAVLAGCEPRHLPVVLAGIEAVLDPAFNAHGVQNTTHFASPVLIVNGPVREQVGLQAGSNVLGFGHRANATIGRAVRLVLALTGGGSPGGLDQSTLGGPHKFGLCFPEHEEASPWEPLHVSYGFGPDESTVTALALAAPAGVSDHRSQAPEQLATTLTRALEAAWAPTWYPLGAETVLVLCPEHAQTFGDAGWSKTDLRDWIFAHARRTAGELRTSGSGELTPFVTNASADDEVIGKFTAPEEVVIVVAGSRAGRWSAVLAPWTGFGKGSGFVQRRIALD